MTRGTRPLHRAIYRGGMRRKVVRDRERGEACREKLRDSYSTFLRTHLVVSSLVHDGALPPPLSTPLLPPFAPPFVLLDPRTCWLGPRERERESVIPRRERIKRVFVRAWASCLSNTSYLAEVSGDSVTL